MSGRTFRRGKKRVLQRRDAVATQPLQKQSKLGTKFRKANHRIERFRKGWIAALMTLILPISGGVISFLWRVIEKNVRQQDEIANSYRMGAAISMEIHGPGTIEVLSSDSKETPVYAADLAMYCQLMNIGLKPIQIVRYVIEVRSGGCWIKFIHVPVQQPHYLVKHSQTTRQPQYFDVSNRSLNDVLRSGALAPGESRGGWVFLKLETRQNYNFIVEELRLTAFDITGRVYTIFPKIITESQYKGLRDNFLQQYGLLRGARTSETRY